MTCHSVNNNNGSCYISLFKFQSFDQFNTPQTASNFKHLLTCGTIVPMHAEHQEMCQDVCPRKQVQEVEQQDDLTIGLQIDCHQINCDKYCKFAYTFVNS